MDTRYPRQSREGSQRNGRRRAPRAIAAMVAATVAFTCGAVGVGAFFDSLTSNANNVLTALKVNAEGTVTATAPGTNVNVSWPADTLSDGTTATTFYVLRSGVLAGGTCAGLLSPTTTSCIDTSVPAGTYTYSVVPNYSGTANSVEWTGTSGTSGSVRVYSNATISFSAVGSHTLTIPAGVLTVAYTLVGAGGGGSQGAGGGPGGDGALQSGTLTLSSNSMGTTLTVWLGAGGGAGGTTGGTGCAGSGYGQGGGTGSHSSGGAGGGASCIYLSGSPSSPIAVAGAGGGGGGTGTAAGGAGNGGSLTNPNTNVGSAGGNGSAGATGGGGGSTQTVNLSFPFTSTNTGGGAGSGDNSGAHGAPSGASAGSSSSNVGGGGGDGSGSNGAGGGGGGGWASGGGGAGGKTGTSGAGGGGSGYSGGAQLNGVNYTLAVSSITEGGDSAVGAGIGGAAKADGEPGYATFTGAGISSPLVYSATSSATTWTSSSAKGVTFPSGTNAGDLLFLLLETNVNTAPGTPTGWTSVADQGSTAPYRFTVWWKLAAVADGGQVTLTPPGGASAAAGWVVRYTRDGGYPPNPAVATSTVQKGTAAASTSFTPAPDVTTNQPYATVISIVGVKAANTLSLGSAHSFTLENQTSAGSLAVGFADQLVPTTAGSDTSPTWSQSSSATWGWATAAFY